MDAQDVQLEDVPLQVEQTVLQASHVLVALLLTDTLAGQEVTHPVKYRYLPETQDRQAVWVVHVAQGVTQLTQSVGFWFVSGYIPLSQLARHVPEKVEVLLRYLKVLLE